jgi:hypothetical protein
VEQKQAILLLGRNSTPHCLHGIFVVLIRLKHSAEHVVTLIFLFGKKVLPQIEHGIICIKV